MASEKVYNDDKHGYIWETQCKYSQVYGNDGQIQNLPSAHHMACHAKIKDKIPYPVNHKSCTKHKYGDKVSLVRQRKYKDTDRYHYKAYDYTSYFLK